MKQLGRITAQRDLADPHSGLSRVLRKEQNRQQTFAQTQWSSDKSQYGDPVCQRQLRLSAACYMGSTGLGPKPIPAYLRLYSGECCAISALTRALRASLSGSSTKVQRSKSRGSLRVCSATPRKQYQL